MGYVGVTVESVLPFCDLIIRWIDGFHDQKWVLEGNRMRSVPLNCSSAWKLYYSNKQEWGRCVLVTLQEKGCCSCYYSLNHTSRVTGLSSILLGIPTSLSLGSISLETSSPVPLDLRICSFISS